MDPKYSTFVQSLDILRFEAPEDNNRYRPDESNQDEIDCARSLSYAHLFLKVKCGIETFLERDKYTCDGKSDGGLDAYYIDRSKRKILLIQSKFRISADGFKNKDISSDDLVKMELDRILNGKRENTNGVKYNEKVLTFQKELQEIGDIALYKFIVIILSNLKRYNDSQIKQLIGGFEYEVFDFSKTYDELVFPLCSATYYDPLHIQIEINLSQKQQPNLTQTITVEGGTSEITLIFAPTREIGRVMSVYKNALLKFNPRNYLSLQNNPVNKQIRDSIISLSTDEFAILNNGITIIADEISLTSRSGKENVGQLIITAPQIINGGQTACTLSEIYENEYKKDPEVFTDKEVMLKIINIQGVGARKPKIIEAVSNATNRQTKVNEADRRSNSVTFVNLQKEIFTKFGYFFERKEGEFFYGIESGILDKSNIIDRVDLVRTYMAFTGDPSGARGHAENKLFDEEIINLLFGKTPNTEELVYAYKTLFHVREVERLHKRGKYFPKKQLGNAFRYGKFAVVSAVGVINSKNNYESQDSETEIEKMVKIVLKDWTKFEKFAIFRDVTNDYFSRGNKDFDNYYKGNSINNDIQAFWSNYFS